MLTFIKTLFMSSIPFFRALALTFAGKFAYEIHQEAMKVVADAEEFGGSGQEKYKYAYEQLKARHPNAKDSFINLAIEIAHAMLMNKVGK